VLLTFCVCCFREFDSYRMYLPSKADTDLSVVTTTTTTVMMTTILLSWNDFASVDSPWIPTLSTQMPSNVTNEARKPLDSDRINQEEEQQQHFPVLETGSEIDDISNYYYYSPSSFESRIPRYYCCCYYY
jgi:hypothetical protein